VPARRRPGRGHRRPVHQGRPLTDLVDRFAGLTGSAAAGAALLARYEEPHRRYHTVEHLEEVLAWIDELAPLAADPAAVELAAWYHDAVYDAAAPGGESERRSADLAVEELLALGRPPGLVGEVRRLVLLTAGHEVGAGDRDGSVLADADLSILGAEPDRYARYVADVRAEYAHVPDDAWATGRAAVLAGFAARSRLYRTDVAHERLDTAARRNLAWERRALSRPG
jgi:predicted metal-dependent HD superfamily phosphohydrolase